MHSVPVLAIPCINRPDLLARCVASIDHPVDRLLVIDNSPDGLDWDPPDHVLITEPPANLGFGGSVNHVIKTHARAPWWCIANADTEFAPGDLARLAAEMRQPGPRWVGITDWRVFGLSFEAVERVGLWDENLFPAYCDDCDYERRCDLAGVPRYFLPGSTSHVGSVAISSDLVMARANARTYPRNVEYYVRKWGGLMRGGETYGSPFDSGGGVHEWSLDITRLRDQQW